MRGIATTRALVALAALALACGEPTSPEDQIRALFASAQQAVGQRDLKTLRAMISEQYTDARGHKKADVERLLAAQVLRGQAHAYLHVQALEVDWADAQPATARATLLAGVARAPIGGLEQLLALRADLWIFDLELEDANPGDGDWQIRRADWRPATTDDLHL